MNSWTFHEDQREIDYGVWAGVPVNCVSAPVTSRICPKCDSRVVNVGNRRLFCRICDKLRDGDELASRNLAVVLSVPAALPSACSEGEPKEVNGRKEGNPSEQKDGSYSCRRRACGLTELQRTKSSSIST